jgi:hypothetical protein
MPATVSEDLIHDSAYDEGSDGRVIVRHLLVEGLERTPAPTLLYRAKLACGVAYGDKLNVTPALVDTDPLYWFRAERIAARPYLNSRDAARVRVDYRDFGGVIIRVNGNVVREMSRVDNTGAKLEVRYKKKMTGTRPWAHPAAGADVTSWPAEVQRAMARPTISFERYDFGTTYDGVEINYAAHVNSAAWQGMPARTWLCSIQTHYVDAFGRLEDSEKIVRRVYNFEYVGGWINGDPVAGDPVLWYKDRNLRVPPPDVDPKLDTFPTVTSGNGWAQRKIEGEKNFATGLALPDLYIEDF